MYSILLCLTPGSFILERLIFRRSQECLWPPRHSFNGKSLLQITTPCAEAGNFFWLCQRSPFHKNSWTQGNLRRHLTGSWHLHRHFTLMSKYIPGTASQCMKLKYLSTAKPWVLCVNLLNKGSNARASAGSNFAEDNVNYDILYNSKFESSESKDEGKPSVFEAPRKRRGPKEKPIPAAVMEELESKLRCL